VATILCIATYLKGEAFLQECHRLGATVLLLTADSLADAAWPHHAIAELHTMPRSATDAEIGRRVGWIARRHRIDRITALDDFDVETAGMLRDFLQVPGFGRTVASRFRDKLTMRVEARRLGLTVPEFTPVFTDADVGEWAARVPPPWVLKPRSSAAATGIKKLAGPDDLWRALERTGDERPLFVLEQFVSGDVYHVDSIVRNGRIVFAAASKYGRPPMQVAHEGGVFTTRRLPDDLPSARTLIEANRTLLAGFDLRNGVSHTEFIIADPGTPASRTPSPEAPAPTFLETSARVGGAFIVDVVEAATGVDLWREWARLELAGQEGAYDAPSPRPDAAGMALCLARQEDPDLSAYIDPEIVRRIRKSHHAGLIVASRDPGRIEALLDSYAARFSHDFLATLPLPERPVE
jgi:biotin carboxylase